MKCKFVTNGIALSYDHIIKPCCMFKHNNWDHTIHNTDLNNWFNSDALKTIQGQLEQDIWPAECNWCEFQESQGRGDSIRLGGEGAYSHYGKDDITLEIRPGNTCNFACQTCWPAASSRVNSYHKQAFGTKDIVSKRYDNFDFLNPIKHRLKDIILLGGEPFYDKNCLNFLSWIQSAGLDANLTLFTNGSVVDWKFVNNYTGKLTTVVSLDAKGQIAEYIRPGTNWNIVSNNYLKLKQTDHVNTRVNVTTSVYNYPFISDLVEWLANDWPEIVTFGIVSQSFLQECVVPKHCVEEIIYRLEKTIGIVKDSNIEEHQIQNTVGALGTIANNLRTVEFNPRLHQQFLSHMIGLDAVKNVHGSDYNDYYEKIKNV